MSLVHSKIEALRARRRRQSQSAEDHPPAASEQSIDSFSFVRSFLVASLFRRAGTRWKTPSFRRPRSSARIPDGSGAPNAIRAPGGVVGSGSAGGRGRPTPNAPSGRPRPFPRDPGDSPTRRQKLALALLVLLCVNRWDGAQLVERAIDRLIRDVITVRVSERQSRQAPPEDDALWKASVHMPQAVRPKQQLRRSSSPSSADAAADPPPAPSDYSIDLVVSHCNLPVDWIFSSFASPPEEDPHQDDDGYRPSSIFRNVTIISKCGLPVVGAPSSARIIRLPNVGRNDHSYAHYLANHYYRDEREHAVVHNQSRSDLPTTSDVTVKPTESSSDPGSNSSNKQKFHAVLFLKDNDNHHRAVYSRQRTLSEMLQITRERGFACHEERIWAVSRPYGHDKKRSWSLWKDALMHPVCQISPYHDWAQLQQKRMSSYVRLKRDRADQARFRSAHGDSVGAYARRIGAEVRGPVVPVCYGGNFMAAAEQLEKYGPGAPPPSSGLWRRMEASLGRASNVAEGHFAERLWAALLSRPLTASELVRLEGMSHAKQPSCNVGDEFQGALTKY